MVRCEYCGSLVNEEYGNCPNCGAPLPETREAEKIQEQLLDAEIRWRLNEAKNAVYRNPDGKLARPITEEINQIIESSRDAEKTIEAETIKCKILMFAFIGVLVAANLAWILSMFF